MRNFGRVSCGGGLRTSNHTSRSKICINLWVEHTLHLLAKCIQGYGLSNGGRNPTFLHLHQRRWAAVFETWFDRRLRNENKRHWLFFHGLDIVGSHQGHFRKTKVLPHRQMKRRESPLSCLFSCQCFPPRGSCFAGMRPPKLLS